MEEKYLKVGNHFIRTDRIIRIEFDGDSVLIITETDKGKIIIPPIYCLDAVRKSAFFQDYVRKNTHSLFDISLLPNKK